MTRLAVIIGSGSEFFTEFRLKDLIELDTPYGAPSAPLSVVSTGKAELVLLPRHGSEHQLAPHKINYRSNIWALSKYGINYIVSVAAVGGITEGYDSGCLVVPDQIIDYTWGRSHTFFESPATEIRHVDFTEPYSEQLRRSILNAGEASGETLIDVGVYGVTQGPRLETAAEINRMEKDGCNIVGMTGMPEASLARELDLAYACCALIVNPAAGRSSGPIELETINQILASRMTDIAKLLIRLSEDLTA
jgi:5'-methylthioinosine phosphorylase